MKTILSLRNFGVKFGSRQILSDVNIDIEDRGIVVLMGPCGTGKSTLLRSLAGINDASPYFAASGQGYYLGEYLGAHDRPILVEQKPSLLVSSVLENIVHTLIDRETLVRSSQRALVLRLLDEFGITELVDSLDTPVTELAMVSRRIVAVIGAVINSPTLVMIDEPTADLNDKDAKKILDVIRRIAARHSVLIVLHNQNQARYVGGKVMLLAGGCIQESKTTDKFFESAESEAGKEFIRTGTCSVPSPDTPPEHLDPEFANRYVPLNPSKEEPRLIPFGPPGFRWLLRGKLAATPRPGLSRDLEDDLMALKKVNVDHLISLEEKDHYSPEAIERHGIRLFRMPVKDMHAPGVEETMNMVMQMAETIGNKGTIAVHCRAGLGRTGTLLACFLVASGTEVEEAISQVRCQDPRMIQSRVQEEFISEFYFHNQGS